MKISSRAAWVALVLAFWGCGSSPDTAYYALATSRGTIRQASLGTIEVRRPGIAGYLDRSEILTQWAGHRLQLADNACWGEPISSMIGRVLAEDLTDRLRGTIVFSASSDLSIQASTFVELGIGKFDLDRDGFVHLQTLLALRSSGGELPSSTRAIALQVRPAAADTGALVATMSDLLGQLADEIAASLIARTERRARETPEVNTSESEPRAQAAEKSASPP